ncbi:MAG: phosphohydrolase, partial [Haloquadratum sp.]|nr:phosphohydrolase [Haloquadratum sp.]
MDEATADPDAAGLRRGSLLPRAGFFTPDGVRDQRRRARIAAALEAASVVVLADGDADGLGAATLIRERYDAHVPAAAVAPRLQDDADETAVPQSTVAVLPTGPYHLLERLALLTELGIDGRPVYVCDLCPDDADAIAEALAPVTAQTDSVVWFDHHRWGDDARAAVEAAGVALTVGDS